MLINILDYTLTFTASIGTEKYEEEEEEDEAPTVGFQQ